mmetsp:Transcript_3010/g.7096  ORF Transcript_3010/g.7096 Transcript_3010/m.7096 type:complete len:459 (-) Transcript_3010:591-1967(-)
MSTNNAISSTNEKNKRKRSCLAIVEADGIFDGQRRVRLPLWSPSTRSPSSNGKHMGQTKSTDDENIVLLSLHGLKESLATSLELPSTTNVNAMEIELYDSKNQSFRRLVRTGDIPPTCCRLRIVIPDSELLQSHPSGNSSNAGQELLALPWREFSSSIDLDGKLVLKGGKHVITIHEVSNSGLGTGTNIWDGAIALAKFLEFHDQDDEGNDDVRKNNDELECSSNPSRRNNEADTNVHSVPDPMYSVRGKRVLELGAGTGLVGIAAHVAFGAREVLLTDLEYSLENLRENLKANACKITNSPDAVDSDTPSTQSCTIDAIVLDWFDLETCDEVLRQRTALATSATAVSTATNEGDENPAASNLWGPEIVLAADVVWIESLVHPLVQTMHRICTKPSLTPPLILLSYQRRSQAVEDLLFQTLEEFRFRIEDVTAPVVSTSTGAESKIRIYRIIHQAAAQ